MNKVMFALMIGATAMPAIAQKTTKIADPNRTICRTTDVIGSRLQTKRTCMTAAQWTRLEREQRETTERVQTSKFSQGN